MFPQNNDYQEKYEKLLKEIEGLGAQINFQKQMLEQNKIQVDLEMEYKQLEYEMCKQCSEEKKEQYNTSLKLQQKNLQRLEKNNKKYKSQISENDKKILDLKSQLQQLEVNQDRTNRENQQEIDNHKDAVKRNANSIERLKKLISEKNSTIFELKRKSERKSNGFYQQQGNNSDENLNEYQQSTIHPNTPKTEIFQVQFETLQKLNGTNQEQATNSDANQNESKQKPEFKKPENQQMSPIKGFIELQFLTPQDQRRSNQQTHYTGGNQNGQEKRLQIQNNNLDVNEAQLGVPQQPRIQGFQNSNFDPINQKKTNQNFILLLNESNQELKHSKCQKQVFFTTEGKVKCENDYCSLFDVETAFYYEQKNEVEEMSKTSLNSRSGYKKIEMKTKLKSVISYSLKKAAPNKNLKFKFEKILQIKFKDDLK